MGLFLQHKMNVPRISIGMLVSLVAEGDLVSVGSTFLNVNFQNFPLLFGTETLALSTAAVTRALHLLDHGTHTNHLHLHASAIATVAGADSKLFVQNLTVDSHLLGCPIVHLLQRNLQWLNDVLGSLSTPASSATTAAAAEHRGENIFGPSTSTATSFNSFQPSAVISCPFLLIAQDVVGHGNLLELLGVPAFVGMVCLRQLEVSPPDFIV
mmetsp:Transcript_34980/g.84498  ORF Transcript_34980/g.84498 Transcript_34980/m.84498 type:complete len:211 (+) Transcript_34980:968-1600(+)